MNPPERLAELAPHYDLVIVGGGITGAGILREALRTGATVLLLERQDFAGATSGWSSKLVHGGLRYLQTGQWRLTLESVRERGRLLRELPGLVEPQVFLMPIHQGRKPGRALMQTGLWLYDAMAGRRASRWIAADAAVALEPELSREGLLGALRFEDARTDDARLVQRLIEDSRALGAQALNYVAVEDLLRDAQGVCGVRVQDRISGGTREIGAGLVINASGVWARQFAPATVAAPMLRPLRGSHLLFDAQRLPLRHAVSWLHPRDGRPVFAYPWEGAVLCGTTDLDHDPRALDRVHMTADEADYLVAALAERFPALALRAADALCGYAGLRPVMAGGKADPSAESRESGLWSSPGLVSVTGGKLTTFRLTARLALAEAARQRPRLAPAPEAALFEAVSADDPATRRLMGRFGLGAAQRLLADAAAGDLQPLGSSPYTLAELRWSARHEQVQYLDDLLLRRTRLGLVTAAGGAEFLPRIRTAVQPVLGWDEARWIAEEARYRAHWQAQHAPPA